MPKNIKTYYGFFVYEIGIHYGERREAYRLIVLYYGLRSEPRVYAHRQHHGVTNPVFAHNGEKQSQQSTIGNFMTIQRDIRSTFVDKKNDRRPHRVTCVANFQIKISAGRV